MNLTIYKCIIICSPTHASTLTHHLTIILSPLVSLPFNIEMSFNHPIPFSLIPSTLTHHLTTILSPSVSLPFNMRCHLSILSSSVSIPFNIDTSSDNHPIPFSLSSLQHSKDNTADFTLVAYICHCNIYHISVQISMIYIVSDQWLDVEKYSPATRSPLLSLTHPLILISSVTNQLNPFSQL